MKRCPYCKGRRGSCCMEVSEEGFYCTRVEGHIGPHIACGAEDHEFSRWERKEETDEGKRRRSTEMQRGRKAVRRDDV